MAHLVGFVRDGIKIVQVTAADPHFFDVTRNSRCAAIVVPLDILAVDAWTLSEDAAYLPRSVMEIIEENGSFVTSHADTAPFYVLMYPRSNNLETSRGGVLLRRFGASVQPIVAVVDGIEYLVELKGCGCPTGGLGGYHLRRTTPKGCHFHIAGALGFSGAIAEFQGLEARRATAAATGGRLELRAVGVCRYSHLAARVGEPLGQVLRLCPSSLRASFRGNDALDPILAVDDRVVSWNLGSESALLLECEDPRIHRNPSLNNLCYVAPGRYVLTDMEACPPLSAGYEALDFEDSVVPDQYRHSSRSVTYFPEILAGMRSSAGRVGALVASHEVDSEPDLTQLVYEADVAMRIFLLRLRGVGSPLAVLERNFDHLRVFVPEAYFEVSWVEWLTNHLIPLFEEKAAILDLYRELAFDGNWMSLGPRLEQPEESCIENRTPFTVTMNRLRNRAAVAKQRLEASCRIGAFVPDRMLETLYVDVPREESVWYGNRRATTEVLTLARSLISNGSLNGHISDAAQDIHSSSWSARDIVYPSFAMVQTYLRNERRILKGVEAGPNYLDREGRDALNASLASLELLCDMLAREPHRLHDLVRCGRSAFARALQLPYMRSGVVPDPVSDGS